MPEQDHARPHLSLNQAVGGTREALRRSKELLQIPTDAAVLQKYLDEGVTDFAWVPCSITDTIQNMAADRARNGELGLYLTNHEHNLAGIATGIYFATGRPAVVHMQNSGLPNAADGFISFASVYKIPMSALVTWRGSNEKDDSEPHQEIGRRTERLTHAVFEDNIHGSRLGRGILHAIERAVRVTAAGESSVVRLSPDAFRKTITTSLPTTFTEFPVADFEKVKSTRGGSSVPFDVSRPASRDDAIEAIQHAHPDAAILYSNGYTSRAAQGSHDRLGNFYNVGYMGGTLAVGWALALRDPDIEVVVVDGDQNAQMSCLKDNLAANYPVNLQWYILNNRIGASVGTAESIPLAPWYYDLARVVPTTPDRPGSFAYPRVRGKGVYFDSDEARYMAAQIGPLPVHARRFRRWIEQTSERNRTNRLIDSVQGLTPS